VYGWFKARKLKPEPSDLKREKHNLGLVADAIYTAKDKGGKEAVLDALSLGKRADWPGRDDFPEHFCGYRVLARLAREGLISEAITLNYDCGFERGLADEGFQFASWKYRGREWLDHATIVTSGSDHASLERRGEMVLTKAHGCAAAYQKAVDEDRGGKDEVVDAVVVRRGQLLDWRTDFWARDLFADRARRHVILLLGVSGEDPVIHIAMTRTLEEVHDHRKHSKSGSPVEPRVIAIDRKPKTVALTSLVDHGCGHGSPAENVITQLKVPRNRTLTSVLIAIGAEMLALRLASEGNLSLPKNAEARIVSLLIAAPTSLRWAYLLERRERGAEFAQRVSLEVAKEKGYVPLSASPARAVEALRVRDALRKKFKMPKESVAEAIANRGFVVPSGAGRALLPPGVTWDELRSVPGPRLRQPTEYFDAPAELDLVLVARSQNGDMMGRSVQTGSEVTIP
jgi:hypothetical protein